ncbi:bifunctional phosphoribosylaminoimidazolecarboxamide formyltransferase/IMP cyclohydrolase [Pseudogracilibacillus sp. SO30301A]|uniref:bifunctional phosphoribosylaminoimidazolecarboxamide formyltransferase/IMP cyclohydrolase n=1 Tax=Pseudogracilibacillus sp. SO30301A TaxID=3098291 RepID=UPI00300DEDD5
MKKRALISVSNKFNLVPFAQRLQDSNYEIISTGGTLKLLVDSGIDAKSVETVTGFPEILEGRVKTLHPNIHGGLLAKRNEESHMTALQENQIDLIDIVVVNLYPFKETVTKEGATEEDIIENIDIGGPTMLRAAAKNFKDVIVVVDPADYEMIADNLESGELDEETRKKLAAKVFRHTANYDAMIARYFNESTDERFPNDYTVTYEKVQDLRYGENPHQQAAFYEDVQYKGISLATAKQLHGKELSFNNIQDANAALEIVVEYDEPAVVAVKHMNPCGIGLADNLNDAFTRAYEADPISIFGGIIACNREVDKATAEQMHEIFLEIVMAPSFTDEAKKVLMQKQNIRLLEMENVDLEQSNEKITTVKGGILVQTSDDGKVDAEDLEVVTDRKPTAEEMEDLLFSWKAVKHVKSNAIVLAKNKQTIGIGAGQMNRIGAANIAIEQAGENAKSAVMASDAFFPMPDTVEAAAKAGVTAIIQPGGSKRDQDSIDVCNANGIAMVYTKMRHFKH